MNHTTTNQPEAVMRILDNQGASTNDAKKTDYPNEVDFVQGDVVGLTWSPTAGLTLTVRDEIDGLATPVMVSTDEHGALPATVADRTLGQLMRGLRAEAALWPDGCGGVERTDCEVGDPDAVEIRPDDLLMPGMTGDLDSVEWLRRKRALDDDLTAEPLPHPTWNRYIVLNDQREALARPGPLIDVGAAVERLTRSSASGGAPFTLYVRSYHRLEAEDAEVADATYFEEALGEEVVRIDHQPAQSGSTRVQVYDSDGTLISDQHTAHDPRQFATTLLVNRAMRAAGYK